MPTKPIKHANKGNIVFLNNGNYDQLYSSILRILGKDAPFAPISFQGSTLSWTAVQKGTYQSISQAPEDQVGTLVLLWEQTKEALRPRLAAQNLEFVLEVPDTSFIFYTEDKNCNDGVLNHRFRLLVTGWACQYGVAKNNNGDDGLRTRMHEAQSRHQNVITQMLDPTGQPIANGTFVYTFDNSISKEEKSDTKGLIRQGICVVGTRLTYTYKQTGQTKTITVQKNIETYPITFAPTTNVHIKVTDQHNRPLQSHKLSIDYGPKHFSVETDGLGESLIEGILYTDPSLQLSLSVDGYGTQTFNVTSPECNITMQVEIKEELHPYLKVVRENHPVAHHSVLLDGKITGTYASDENGIIRLEGLQCGHTFTAKSLTEKTAGTQSFIIREGISEYIYSLPPVQEKPAKANYHVKAIRRTTQESVPEYSLRFESTTMNGIRLTDNQGIVPLENVSAGNIIKVYISKTDSLQYITIESSKEEYLVFIEEENGKEPKPDIQNCHIKLVEGNEQNPVGDYSLRIESDTMHGYFLTDTYGILPLENMTTGIKVTCYLSPEEKPIEFVIEENKTEYLIQLKSSQEVLQSDIKITLVDRDRTTPVTPATITLTNGRKERFTQRNDHTGSIIVPRTFFKHKEKVRFHAIHDKQEIRDCKFKYTDDCEHYIIYLTDRTSWKKFLWLVLPILLLLCFVRCERDITVHTVDSKGKSIAGAMVQLKYNEHCLYKNNVVFWNKSLQMQGITNTDGYYTFKDTPCSVYSYLFYCFQKALATGSRNALSNGSSTFWYHWQKNIEIVITGNKTVQVKSLKTDLPIAQAKVDIKLEQKDESIQKLTDENGVCHIEADGENSMLLEQITATKPGYSGTRLTDIEIDLDDPTPYIVYLDDPTPCQDQGDENSNGEHGNLAIRDYDMGKAGGEFIFNYYTDYAADEISIYDGSSADYADGNANRIFHYNGATCTTTYQHHESIKFTSQYICVVVEGGTNWGYVVQCPFA